MSHELYMLRCLELAQRAKGQTSPNPMVGAVLVHEGRILAEGWHHHYGADHAEINCLRHVAPADRHLIKEATMYVNLEPCAHFGITPPCSTRLVEEQVKEVVICNADPFEKVSGRGIDILQAGNIRVVQGVLQETGYWVNRRYFCYHLQHRPYVILKWAQTPQGFIAPTDKSRFRITADAAMQLSHKWRTEEAAIMVGTTTAINDNPQLTARLWSGRQPLRIVIDRTLRMPQAHHLYDDAAATWVVNEKKEGLAGNVHYIKSDFGPLFLQDLLQHLYQSRIVSVIIEGGARLLESFADQGLWDEARILTGQIDLPSGIRAPALTNANLAFTTALDGDAMQLFVNNANPYQYPASCSPQL